MKLFWKKEENSVYGGMYKHPIEGYTYSMEDSDWEELRSLAKGKKEIQDRDGIPTLVDRTVSEEDLSAMIRIKRNRLINEIEWRVSRYQMESISGGAPTEDILPILEYIKALRDIPQQENFPYNVIWPERL
jgi:hypothetical protein